MDDFAFRWGTRYGTVLVDLERHTLVDVLPDRSADTFARWLGEHPGVEVVSRDRGGEYTEAARRVAPEALQVADRFHLLKNLRDVVSRVFRQHTEMLNLVPTPALCIFKGSLTSVWTAKPRRNARGSRRGSSSTLSTPFRRRA